MARPKKPRGRPPKNTMPERVDASPEELAKAMFKLPAGHKWKYLGQDKDKETTRGK